MITRDTGVGTRKNGLLKGAAIALVAGLALSMAGCDKNEPQQPQGTVDVSPLPSPSTIDTPASTPVATDAPSGEQSGSGSGQDQCEVGTSFDVGKGSDNIRYLGQICFGVSNLQRPDPVTGQGGTQNFSFQFTDDEIFVSRVGEDRKSTVATFQDSPNNGLTITQIN